MALINGEYSEYIAIQDRGFQYGDGVFETLEVLDGKALFLEKHLDRMQKGCRALHIPMPDAALIAREAVQLCSETGHGVLKITVTRGCGGRGYRQPIAIAPTRVLSLFPYPDYDGAWPIHGIVTRLCHHRLPDNTALAGIKHMNRLDQVLARTEWQDEGIQEGMMLNQDGELIEGVMSNVFLVKNGVLSTPVILKSGVAGIAREIIMELAVAAGLELKQQTLDIAMLYEADEVFVTNSVIGIWPVRQFEQRQFAIGPLTVQLQQTFAESRKNYDYQTRYLCL